MQIVSMLTLLLPVMLLLWRSHCYSGLIDKIYCGFCLVRLFCPYEIKVKTRNVTITASIHSVANAGKRFPKKLPRTIASNPANHM